ncbi:unnamed protein product [Lymnaea stagnalis]|uniref:L-Fucosyltransferase n=1 Tax=Lymnaea stagnalis TaxID=6523 RepID=A0AAV2HK85_LYMST
MPCVRSSLRECLAWRLRSGLLKMTGAVACLIVLYMSALTTLNSIDESQANTGPFYLTTIFQSRLGNHLFIYASLLGLARAQNRTPFIPSGTYLDNVFQISHVDDSISAEGFRLMRHTTFGVVYPSLWNLPRENITLHGPREVFRYFENIEDEVRREFTFCAPLQRQINETLGKVRAEFKGHVIVGVHVRRGDFLIDFNKKLGFGVPKVSYFINAFHRMRSMLKGRKVTFLTASDDLEWCHENLNFTDVKILEPGSAELHFGVLANCDHVILSSGTYGWWAAWLADGISIYYDGYFSNGSRMRSDVNLSDYYPPRWIAVGD